MATEKILTAVSSRLDHQGYGFQDQSCMLLSAASCNLKWKFNANIVPACSTTDLANR